MLNFTDQINLKRNDKFIPLSNLGIYYPLKNIKSLYKSNNSNYQLQQEMINLNYLMDEIQYQIKIIIIKIIKIIFTISSKNIK